MSFLLIICVTLVTLSMSFSPAAFQSDNFTRGNTETDRLALLKLKSKFTDYYYSHEALYSWNDSDHFSWAGIKCNQEHPRRVTVLGLSRQELGFYFRVSVSMSVPPDLVGEIPQEIGWLFRLQYLDLSYNQLSGEIPSSLKNCLELKGLYLGGNNLGGIIPPFLQSLKGIQELILEHNQLAGPFPGYLESFHYIKKLDLSDSLLSGEIPSSLGNCLDSQGLYLT